MNNTANLLHAAAHPKRLQILKLLSAPAARPLSVSDIFKALSASQATTSQHLIKLKDKGVLVSEKISTKIYYSVAPGLQQAVRKLILIADELQ